MISWMGRDFSLVAVHDWVARTNNPKRQPRAAVSPLPPNREPQQFEAGAAADVALDLVWGGGAALQIVLSMRVGTLAGRSVKRRVECR